MENINDTKLEALIQAEYYWRKAFYEGKLTKLAYAEDLNRYGIFSLSQIAKIVRLYPAELSRHGLSRNGRGGRFEPESLAALIRLRKQKLKDENVSTIMIKGCVESGTSWACVSYLTGISYNSFYSDGGPLTSVRARSLKQTEKQAIVIALRAGADPVLLAQQYNITPAYVMEIKQAHANV